MIPPPPMDCKGLPLAAGAQVRVIGLPENLPADSLEAFRHVLGTYRRIISFDKLGNAEIVFRFKGSIHTIYLEPCCLRLKITR